MKYTLTSVLFLLLLLTGCQTKPKEFITLSLSVETVGVYKFSIEINNDKSYQIRKQNIFFDKIAKEERINTSQGYLTDDEFEQLTKLIAASRLFKMKDAYGFNQGPNPDNPLEEIISQLIYTEGTKTKYISIRSNSNDRYSEKFLQLIRFLSNYISEHST